MLLPIYCLLWPYPSMPNAVCLPIIVVWMVVGAIYLYSIEKGSPAKLDAMGRVMVEG